MIKRLLIANRGEIACRIIRTCRRLGIETVAVYSDADADALHTRSADQAVYLGRAAPNESYLNIPKILEAVAATGADGVHPGYGFLSENAEFVAALERADCTFVGPTAKTIKLMGSKADAKATMEAAGVPVVPGYHGEDQSDEVLTAQARTVGFPLMLKAAAGGGGKGMRIVHRDDQFADALSSARRESLGAFGDSRMIMERYVETPRHLEVQVFGDGRGNVVHLFERDCSSQRRYQKVLEESPAPGITDEQRQGLWQAGVDAAAAVDYRGAGTVEFIANTAGEFFFMEMNTRLQVEHPVTEAVTNLDLVEWQLRIAAGYELPLAQHEIESNGHALEARLYAEDPDQGFLPSSGKLTWLEFPENARSDSGFVEGDTVSVHYDPMVAKLICWAPTRPETLAQMGSALANTRLSGPKTNLAFLARLIREPAFTSGTMHTALLDKELPQPVGDSERHRHLVAAALMLDQPSNPTRAADVVGLADPHSPWAIANGWRIGQPNSRHYLLEDAQSRTRVQLVNTADGLSVTIDQSLAFNLRNIALRHSRLSWEENGRRHSVIAHQPASGSRSGQEKQVHVASGRLVSLIKQVYLDPGQGASGSVDSAVLAPMPGKIVTIRVAIGDAVSEGQELLVMEAMKMELSLKAPAAGVVAAVNANVDSFVEADTCLLELDLTAHEASGNGPAPENSENSGAASNQGTGASPTGL